MDRHPAAASNLIGDHVTGTGMRIDSGISALSVSRRAGLSLHVPGLSRMSRFLGADACTGPSTLRTVVSGFGIVGGGCPIPCVIVGTRCA